MNASETRVARMIREIQAEPASSIESLSIPRLPRVIWMAFAFAVAGMTAFQALAQDAPAKEAAERWELREGTHAYRYHDANPAQLSPHVLLFLPRGYQDRRSPLLLMLHGAGSRGDDPVSLESRMHVLRHAHANPDFPFIVAVPQAPAGASGFDPAALASLVDELEKRLPVDSARIYATGTSMGSTALWRLAAEHPGRLAAILPVSSTRPDPGVACRIKDTPVWALHNQGDETTQLQPVREMIQAIRACHGRAHLTVYPKAGHDAWTETYRDPAVYEWLAAQRR